MLERLRIRRHDEMGETLSGHINDDVILNVRPSHVWTFGNSQYERREIAYNSDGPEFWDGYQTKVYRVEDVGRSPEGKRIAMLNPVPGFNLMLLEVPTECIRIPLIYQSPSE